MSSKPDSLLKRARRCSNLTLTRLALPGLAALLAATRIDVATPAQAQIGTIFSDRRRGPPGSIPRGQPQPQIPMTTKRSRAAAAGPRAADAPDGAAAGPQGNVCRGRCESQPWRRRRAQPSLPPNQPPSVAVAPPNPQAARVRPGQRQPQQKGGPGGTCPADAG
jgi:hypothetical protein